MQPGLTRAVPLGIIGFLVGALLVIVIRALQNLDPIWAVGPGIVLGTFGAAFFFVWGMGAFDPRMSVHGEHAAEAHPAEAEEKPLMILGGYVWQITFILTLLLIALMAFAWLPTGLTLITVGDPVGSAVGIGYFPVTIGDTEIQVSELVVFIGFILITLVLLALVAGGIGFIFHALAQGVTEAKSTQMTELGPGAFGDKQGLVPTLLFLVTYIILAAIIFAIFYYVAVGLVMPDEPMRTIASLANALIIAILLLRPKAVVRFVAHIAAIVARFLRRVPGALQ